MPADLLAVSRERRFSPGRVADDAAVLDRTAERLEGLGFRVERVDGDRLPAAEDVRARVVLAMCQGAEALEWLDRVAARAQIVNAPDAIRNCYRARMLPRFAEAEIPQPPWQFAGEAPPPALGAGPWLKRGDVHAMEPGDVRRVFDLSEWRAALDDFSRRQIRRAVVQSHVDGDVYKFYGVAGGFFRAYGPSDTLSETLSGTLSEGALERAALVAAAGARALGLDVYGGDGVAAPDGSIQLIDFNDWPSFARCREDAAHAIAARVEALAVENRDATRAESRRIFGEEQRVLAPGIQRIALLSELTLAAGNGATVEDVDGNRYVDFFAGVAVASLGHSHPRWVSAMEGQIRKIAVGSFTTENRLRFLKALARVTPGALDRAQLYSGGAEAVEAAIRLAKSYTRKYEVLGFWGGFHGKTSGVVGLIGDPSKHGWGPLPGSRYLTPYADCYRCPLGLEYPSCGIACAEFAKKTIENSTAGAVAAVLIEPMQGTAGNVVPPPEFLPAIREVAKSAGALLVADEMITGFGRTGKMFAVEHTGVVPDVMTLGKGMASGFPVAAVLSSDEVVRAEPFSKPSASSSSYGGNPLAATAALATLETIVEEGLVERSRALGERMLSRLREMKEKYEFVGDVRGAGLLLGLDLVRDRKTKEPIDRKLGERIFLECLRRGLLAMCYMPRVRLNPPLTITEAQVDEGLGVLDEVFAEVQKEGRYR